MLHSWLASAIHPFAAYLTAANGAPEAMARYLERGRGAWLAHYGYLAAAQIDLAFPSLGLVGAKPFNGQINRMEIFREILEVCDISMVVETGCCRGSTTEYMARNFSGKVYSCEVDRRYFEYSARRLKDLANVELQLIDSRQLLRQLFKLPLPKDQAIFYYLDAHWNEDLPLLGEISLALDSEMPAVIMIDDFEVPFDQGFGYDIYGKTKLCLGLLSGFRDRMGHSYFPARPAGTETGPRRGSVIFATSAELGRRLEKLPSLKPVTPRDWSYYSS
jgi:hypothetical protein